MTLIPTSNNHIALVSFNCERKKHYYEDVLSVKEVALLNAIYEIGYDDCFIRKTLNYYRQECAWFDMQELRNQAWLYLDANKKQNPKVTFFIERKDTLKYQIPKSLLESMINIGDIQDIDVLVNYETLTDPKSYNKEYLHIMGAHNEATPYYQGGIQ